MLEHIMKTILPEIICGIELIGIFVICVAVLRSFWYYLLDLVGKRTHKNLKLKLAHGMATGLEFKVAAEILKTVIAHELSDLLIVGCVIALRIVLTVLIHFEAKSSKEEFEEEEAEYAAEHAGELELSETETAAD